MKFDELLKTIFVVLAVVAFFYFGYRDDFNRNPKKFLKTVFSVFILFGTTVTGLFGIIPSIKKWLNKS